jgi:bifunctional DNase/RNase
MARFISVLDGDIERVIIDDVQEDSFLAPLFVRRDNQVFALALRSRARIFVSETVLLQASRPAGSVGQGTYPSCAIAPLFSLC